MKHILSLLLLSNFLLLQGYCQNVAVNNISSAPDPSAMLDVSSASKGMLIPRIALNSLADAATIPNPATSLLVYNTNISLTGGAGFYYNSGTPGSPTWTRLAPASENLWRTQPGFIELIPNQPLYLQNSVGIGTVAPSEKLHIPDGNIKVGEFVWSNGNDRMIKFGDGDYARIGEAGEDDAIQFLAKHFWFRNSGVYSGNVGIGTIAAPTAKLEVNGSFKLTNGNQGAGKILSSDASGTASWVNSPTAVGFKARNFSAISYIPVNVVTQLATTLEDYDPGLNFFNSAFTVPTTGFYHFDAKAYITLSAPDNTSYSYMTLYLFRNGAQLEDFVTRITDNAITYNTTLTVNSNHFLAAGDVITLHYRGTAGADSGPSNADNVVFSGFRIY